MKLMRIFQVKCVIPLEIWYDIACKSYVILQYDVKYQQYRILDKGLKSAKAVRESLDLNTGFREWDLV